MIKQHLLPNGTRLIYEKMEHVRSVAMGVWVDTGSVRETAENAGASHLIEHMVFKGTERRDAEQIAIEMDAIGGNINAYTSKENTCFYAKVLDEHLDVVSDVLSDITFHSVFDPEELKKEQGVVLEEILMNEDSPEDLSGEESNMLFFGDEALASPILGSKESVRAFTRESLLAYKNEFYVPNNIVVSVAGNFEEQALIDSVTKWFDIPASPRATEPILQRFPGGKREKLVEKDVEQVHICMTLPGFARDSEGQYPLAVLSNIFGGSMSSRLFQSIREKLGLAYSVYSYPTSYTGTGTLTLYAGTGEKQAKEVLNRMMDEMERIRKEGITKEEFNRSRDQLKGSYLLGMESSSARMNALGKTLLLQKREYSEQETLRRIECVTMDDIERILPVCFDRNNASIALVGRVKKQEAALLKAIR
ncbi:MAG: peptidase M16 [Firmicutes bacterium HGW-Firmicutes-9]|jgi:predicted Zn-dependent peptidase|nr:MAG: peptidase M16 [Firmicutes bacterium HGW-Firmicutes-9]